MTINGSVTAGTLIVGASQAGLQLAVSLRELGDSSPITLVGEELHQPYQRPPLSKEFLAGDADVASLAFRVPAFYADSGIELVCGEQVTGARLTKPAGGGVATTASGRMLPFDRLALTVGAAPRQMDVPGSDLDGICYLRDSDDAVDLRSRLEQAANVVVVGGGFIGLEATAAARAQGRSVTVVEAADRLLPRAVAPVVSDFYRRAHERRGVRVLLESQVAGFTGDREAVTAVQLADGRELPADLVLVGVGIVPRTELAGQLGLECDGGIVVDVHARTSEPSVVSAGDCTVQPHPMTGLDRVRLESVQNAVAQATVAAKTLMAQLETPRTVPWFWSYQGDLKLQIAGLSAGYDQHVVRGEPDTERFSVLYYRDGQLLAIDAVNNAIEYMVVRKALTQGANIPADAAGDASIPLKSSVVAATSS
jgi:3-phenylpropionate/trans-cinnamate dioxygenase ferredoxin reductase component